MSSPRPPRVFISYSHDSEAHAERVLKLADRLRRPDIDAWIDQYEPVPDRGWSKWMEDQVERADVVVCLCTETYRRRFDQREVPGRGRGVTWEASLLRLQLYLDQGENRRIVPAVFAADDQEHIPTPLKVFTFFDLGTDDGYESLYRHLTRQPKNERPPLGSLRTLRARSRRSLLGETVPAIDAYRDWAEARYSHLELIGIDAGDVRVELDEVYVPLRLVHHRTLDGDGMGMFRGTVCRGEGLEARDIEIDEILAVGDLMSDGPRHALIFGEPGSGKTTALIKLHQLCWQDPGALGLEPGTVPIFLRLRHLDRELLDTGLAAFVDHEIRELSGGRLPELGETLWNHSRLLLLFDGLDEIADADYRAEVLRRIGWYLQEDGAADVRAVVSCRRLGLPPGEADRDRLFRTLEVRPFQDEQIAQLVKLWFRELARRGRIDQATADQRVEMILHALTDRRIANQQLLGMVSNPLLLTLLCVVVLLGNEIPRKRVRFYEQCLDVLLDRWPRQKGREPPVDLNAARDALGRLAFRLHSERRRDDLQWAEAVATLIGAVGDRAAARELFDWLHADVGLLVDYTEKDYGFVHLGIQEHLTARHLIAHPDALDVIAGNFDESWWAEVFLQLAALSEQDGFDGLMTRLLHHTDALERRAGLLRDCLRETTRPRLSAFVRVLEADDETRQAAVLRLVRGVEHRPQELVEAAKKLAADGTSEVRQAARQWLAARAAGGEDVDRVGLLFGSSEDEALAKELAERLQSWRGGWPAEVAQGTGRRSGDLLESCRTAVILLGSTPGAWSQAAPLREIYEDLCWLAVRLPGEPRPVVPEIFEDCEVLDWQLGDEDRLIETLIARLPETEPDEALPLAVQTATYNEGRFVEPVTRMELLPVPAGSFVMGCDDLWTDADRKLFGRSTLEAPTPTSRVWLSAFLLGRTAVTNGQYSRFLEATGHREPQTWRDRRFSDAEQPVVGVCWDDAVEFCKWLTAENPDGWIFTLPSEAQWEHAARGAEGRTYPWGEDRPSSVLACFGLNSGQGKPAAVGSYLAGAGPFGHLDLAGGVWEWCRDAWEPNLSKWSQGRTLDPVGTEDPTLRPLRGGSWWGDAGDLRSAVRGGVRPGNRDVGYGFRVSCAPPSSTS